MDQTDLPLTTRAPAKVNLTLRVAGRRPDGYHELDSLTAFTAGEGDGVADGLSLLPGASLSLTVTGDTAVEAGPDDDNLVLRAARALQQLCPGLQTGRFTLEKRLPVAAGLGGGSSDAAAALRLLARLNGLAADDARLREAAAATGADVPVCLAARARVMAGLGEVLGPQLTLPALPALLVNPRVAVSTPAVFRALAASPLQAGSPPAMLTPDVATEAGLRRYLLAGWNDLEAPARSLCPEISEALELVQRMSGCWLARMSGSGATVFGLFDDQAQAEVAAGRIHATWPAWWARPVMLA
ncbi:4-diphosphocytidyl-2-C-methyl-D-erythritol kinase [Camelimonas fluminis]|uniref:4-diphosphocytidyl-2-C-methyl-D-erythritol kinase n=1 Tax=Camelimonas fluminis TaxID=1576911 RepID=A0ABV7UCH4_9HYPH|nr:4-(cytidine 5'-diphospho)-2-C-methyl-D-erythritol kinase [Camelimonas fluminis]GHE47591.1 4-diphosphocytidyl-2-C-methyl-D-erythritol kinase [Camelimonas fluminis]